MQEATSHRDHFPAAHSARVRGHGAHQPRLDAVGENVVFQTRRSRFAGHRLRLVRREVAPGAPTLACRHRRDDRDGGRAPSSYNLAMERLPGTTWLLSAWLRPPGFARAITVDDAALCQIVRRDLEIDPVTWQNLDAVTAQATRDVREDRMSVLELDREGRTRKDLLDRAVHLKRFFLDRSGFFGRNGLCARGVPWSTEWSSSSDDILFSEAARGVGRRLAG